MENKKYVVTVDAKIVSDVVVQLELSEKEFELFKKANGDTKAYVLERDGKILLDDEVIEKLEYEIDEDNMMGTMTVSEIVENSISIYELLEE